MSNLRKTQFQPGFKGHTIVLLGVCIAIAFSCGRQEPDKKETAAGVVTVVKGKVHTTDQPNAPLAIGSRLKAGDTIKTGKNAMVLVQIQGLGLFRVLEKTKVTFKELSAQNSEFRISKGGVFANMQKLKKDQQFRISTIAAVAAVRGTRFLVVSQNKKPRIIVSEGSVALTAKTAPSQSDPAKEVILTAGQTATLAAPAKKKKEAPAEFKIRKQTTSEKLNMQQFEIAKYSDDAGTKDNAALATDAKAVLATETAFEKKNRFSMVKIGEENLSPVDRLRKNGKPLTKLFLVGGEIFIGFIESQDAKVIKLNTGDALITINKSDVIKREAAK